MRGSSGDIVLMKLVFTPGIVSWDAVASYEITGMWNGAASFARAMATSDVEPPIIPADGKKFWYRV